MDQKIRQADFGMSYKRILLFVLDGCGCGPLPDYRRYHPKPSNTLASIYKGVDGFTLPCLERLGLSQILGLGRDTASANFGKLKELSKGNDTFAGVWEMFGYPLPYRGSQSAFSGRTLKAAEHKIKSAIVGNEYISGYIALDKYYEMHRSLHAPILYFSDDGVILFAGHVDVIRPELLNKQAAVLGKMLRGKKYTRIITRSFSGKPGAFERDESVRRDILISVPRPRLVNALTKSGAAVYLTEHLQHLFGDPVGTQVVKECRTSNDIMKFLNANIDAMNPGLFVAVFQDTDNFGHRKDTQGFRNALQELDRWLGGFLGNLRKSDLLIITADHGCDPLQQVRGHNREFTPLMLFSPGLNEGSEFGIRNTFADIGQSIAGNFEVPGLSLGKSIL
jgi:phosphopentomutase